MSRTGGERLGGVEIWGCEIKWGEKVGFIPPSPIPRFSTPSPGILYLLHAGGLLFQDLLRFALQDASPACAVSIAGSFLSCPRDEHCKEFTSLFQETLLCTCYMSA